MDIITHLQPSSQKTCIWVIVDRLSKYAHFCAFPTSINATQLASHFVQEYVCFHSFPKSIVSDRNWVFMSQFWREISCLHGKALNMSSAYHPQSDGQTKVVNHCLKLT